MEELKWKRKAATFADAYLLYTDTCRMESIAPVPYKQYRKLLVKAMQVLVNEVVLKSRDLALPKSLGVLRIEKKHVVYDIKKLKVDFAKTKETGQKVYHLNGHTDGFYVRWKWAKATALIKNKKIYCFKPTRANRRFLGTTFASGTADYFETITHYGNS
jgi:hypothetical protein